MNLILLAICCAVLFPAIVSFAAEGTLQFSDPTGKVGEEITVKVKMEGGGAAIGDGDATLTYDTAMLEFVSGTNATGGNGTVSLSASGTGSETELNFELVFKALAEGSTTIQVSGSTAYLYSDETLNLSPGTSTITIEPGDGTAQTSAPIAQGDADIEISGTMYAIYENFTDALIPDGFTRTTIQYNGSEHNAISQDVSGKKLVFLVTGSNDPITALYEEGSNQFIVAERVNVTDEFYIFILGEADGSSLPENFAETTLELNGTIFPAWENTESTDYYLMYALSSNGDEGFYQYDKKEGTYQRYTVPEKEEVEEEPDNSIIGKAKALVDQYFLVAAAAIGMIVLLLLIIIIVQAIKLGRRNAELDELYEQYDNNDRPAVKERSRKQFVGYQDDDDDADINDSDFNDEFIEDDFDDTEDYIADEADDNPNAFEFSDDEDDFNLDIEEEDDDADEFGLDGYDDDDEYEDDIDEFDEDDFDNDEDDEIRFIDI